MRDQSSARFSIIPARAVGDVRLGAAAFRVLAALGTYSDERGWCWPSLATIGRRIGTTKQAVARQIGLLVELDYLEAHAQVRRDGGNTVKRYRIRHDVGSECEADPRQPDVDAPSTSDGDAPSTSDVDGILEGPIERSKERLASRAARARATPALPGIDMPGRKRRRRARFPEAWRDGTPDEAMDAAAKIDRMISATIIAAEFAKFRDHHTARASMMADWLAAWRTWVRRIEEFGRRGPPIGDRAQRSRLSEAVETVCERLNGYGDGDPRGSEPIGAPAAGQLPGW